MTDDRQASLRVRATLWRGAEAVGGRLTVTHDRLEFRPHAVNVQTEPLDIQIQNITGLRPTKSLGLFPNGLAVTTSDGTEHRFVLSKRNQVLSTISERMS